MSAKRYITIREVEEKKFELTILQGVRVVVRPGISHTIVIHVSGSAPLDMRRRIPG
jgi:hypothetical protein